MTKKTKVSEENNPAALANAIKTDSDALGMTENVRLGTNAGNQLIARFEMTGKEILALDNEEMAEALCREHVDQNHVFGIDWHSDTNAEFKRIPWPQVNEIKALLRQRIATGFDWKSSAIDSDTH